MVMGWDGMVLSDSESVVFVSEKRSRMKVERNEWVGWDGEVR